MDPLGSRYVRGYSLEIGMAFCGSVVRRETRGEPTTWIDLEREIAMRRVEELVECSMPLVLHDWELYRAEKAKR
jgi:hypothetical protein